MRFCGPRKFFPLIEAVEASTKKKITLITVHDFNSDETEKACFVRNIRESKTLIIWPGLRNSKMSFEIRAERLKLNTNYFWALWTLGMLYALLLVPFVWCYYCMQKNKQIVDISPTIITPRSPGSPNSPTAKFNSVRKL